MKEAASNLKGYPLDTNNIRTISLEHCKLYVPKRYYEAIIENDIHEDIYPAILEYEDENGEKRLLKTTVGLYRGYDSRTGTMVTVEHQAIGVDPIM